MASSNQETKKRRIRKTPPTVREKAELARAEAERNHKPGLVRRLLSALAWPFKKIRIPSNPITRAFNRLLRRIKRFIIWLIPKYFINSWHEVKLVTWPSRRETWRLTAAVFVFALVFGLMVAGVDKVLDEFFKKVILR